MLPSAYGWCGQCGYTGRVRGPRQAACKQWIWHRWLERCVDLHEVPLVVPLPPEMPGNQGDSGQ
jgi:hypothetical protein